MTRRAGADKAVAMFAAVPMRWLRELRALASLDADCGDGSRHVAVNR